MIDIKLIRENPDLVKENMKKKFQEHKICLVDNVLNLDSKKREIKNNIDNLRMERNNLSSQIGALMKENRKSDAENMKSKVSDINQKLSILESEENSIATEIREIMLKIPNIIHESVPIGENDSKNVEVQRFGEPFVPDYEIPYHADILESFSGIDLDAARRVAGQGFYYLIGDIARLHSAILSYARDFMINKGFTYVIPPYMIRGDVVTGVMSFEEMDNMMYKIENEDLYLIGTSEHSMIGKFKDQILKESELPYTLTSYSPCFRKEKGAHGIEERGIYRIHQFEKQEMIVVCKPEESYEWYDKMWSYTIELFRSLDIPVRTLECCSRRFSGFKSQKC